MYETRIGRKINKLTVLESLGKDKYRCLCDCGNETIGDWKHIRRGAKKSCGCIRGIIKPATVREHSRIGAKDHPLYGTWRGMLRRCYDEKHQAYKDYGKRGITVCDEWQNDFFKFVDSMGDRPTIAHTVDRLNVNGNYEPENCRWATKQEQSGNTRTTISVSLRGVRCTLAAARMALKVSEGAVRKAVEQGFLPHEALAIAVGRKKLAAKQEAGINTDWNKVTKKLPSLLKLLELYQ